jgi:hypothetical protein
MADEEFEEEEAEPAEPDDIDAELEDEDEFGSDVDIDVDDVEDVLVDEGDEVAALVVAEGDDEEDEVVDLEEELHPDDVEEPLDVLLLERTSSGLLDEDEYDDEDDGEADDKSDPSTRIPPKRPGEFVCRSCFLVKHPSQLADAERMLCADCI